MQDQGQESSQSDGQNLNQGYITDPQEFLSFAIKDKKIKVTEQLNPIWKNVYLRDISLNKKGLVEDYTFSKVDRYYKNIRRGNTIIYEKQANKKQQQYALSFCRRGMRIVYDLEPQYLKIGVNLPKDNRRKRKRIFQGIDEQFEKGNSSFHLYCLFKENGEHCQISFVNQLNCWLFASKNVAVLASNTLDLEKNYRKERYIWVRHIGKQFFNILQTFSEEKIENFKIDIEGFTLLGEYCGNAEDQHLIRYQKVEIIFYGLVKNNGLDHCQPVDECRAFLKKYSLKMSHCRQKKDITDKDTLHSCMFEMLKQIGEGSMQKEGEGSIMYIVNQRENKQKTISMCQLKTCQHLIYQKFREMLTNKKGYLASNNQKYQLEIENLIKAYFKPPKTIEFYHKLANNAVRFIQNNPNFDQTCLKYKFVDFIKQFQVQIYKEEQKKESLLKKISQTSKRIILVCLPRLAETVQKYCKMRRFRIDYMYQADKPLLKTTVHILYMIPQFTKLEQNTEIIIAQYNPQQISQCIEQLKQSKDITKSHLITFIKSEDKEKQIQMFNDKLTAFRLSCIDQKIRFRTVSNPNQQNFIREIESLTQSKQQLQVYPKQYKSVKYFLLPLLLPGSGKSTLAKQLIKQNKDSNCQWKTIDVDNIRQQIMQQYNKGKKVDLNDEKSNRLYVQAKWRTNYIYQKQLYNQAHIPPVSGNEYVFVDRLFYQQKMQQAIKLIFQNDENDSARIVVISQVQNPVTLNQIKYPYSLNYLLTCIKRCIERENHQTLCTNPEKICQIIVNYYSQTIKFRQQAILKLNSDKIKFLRFDFTQDEGKYPNEQIKTKIQQCLKTVQNQESQVFKQLIQLIDKSIKFEQQKRPQKHAMFRLQLQKRLNQFY